MQNLQIGPNTLATLKDRVTLAVSAGLCLIGMTMCNTRPVLSCNMFMATPMNFLMAQETFEGSG